MASMPPPGGYGPGTPLGPGMGAPAPSSTLSIVSLVLGILSIPANCCCLFVSAPLAIGGIICGFIAMGQVNQGRAGGKGLAIAGIICGAISILIGVLLFILTLTGVIPNPVLDQMRQQGQI